ncbi:MAG: hypothetical protein C4582_13145 [Desulfobacteraceae bacterium]|jgi:hypothetical protein|nr:MAG: hypothetical protein C4582_13145 [Desulfobacteraceae bacterium]
MKRFGLLALILFLTVGSASEVLAELRIENLCFRASKYGPVKGENVFSLGEWIHMSMDITGLKTDPGGMQDVELYVTVLHEGGETLMPRKRMIAIQEKPLYNQARLAAVFRLMAGDDWPPGKYTLTLDAEDRAASSNAQAKANFVQVPLKPALINLSLTADKEGEIPIPWVVQKAMKAYIQFTISGIGQGEDRGVDFTLDLLVRDEQKRPVGQGRVLAYNAILKERMILIPAHVSLSFNIPGKLEYELVLKDRKAQRSLTATLPITVME